MLYFLTLKKKLLSTEVQDLKLQDDIKVPLLQLCKEIYPNSNKDSLGTDGLVIEPRDDNSYHVHFLQLKLGYKNMDKTFFTKVGDRWSTMKNTATEAYKNLLKTDSFKFFYYLVSTKPFIPTDGEAFKQSYGAEIIGANILTQYVWPDSVKQLGKPYK